MSTKQGSTAAAPAAAASQQAPLPGWVCAAIGGMSGTVEVCVNQPTVSFKNRLQQGLPISFNPLIMYRGTFVNAVSIAPITAIQFGVAGLLTKQLSTGGRELTNAERIGVSLAGGAVSATVVCPADMLIIQQQKSGLSLGAQISTIVKEHGASKLGKGFVTAVGRESLFVAGYLGLAGILRDVLVQASPATFADSTVPAVNGRPQGNLASLLGASMGAGITAAVLTHPIDTIKTRLQSDLRADSPYKTIRETARVLWAEGGLSKFYTGLLPRTTRICVAVVIFNQCNTIFGEWFRKLGY